MAKLSYDRARADFEYLETLAELEDQVELDARRLDLMQDPTKERAAEMYASACRMWLDDHLNDFITDPRVVEIDDRYL